MARKPSRRKPTVGEILATGKKKAAAKRKQQIAKAKLAANIPLKGAPRFVKPTVRAGVGIADIVSRVSQEIVNQAADIAFRDFQNTELPSPRRSKTILPNVDQINRTVDFIQDLPITASGDTIRSDAQLINDEIMRMGFEEANSKARKKNGQLKKGMTQKKIAKMAQLFCTKERKRLGLCKDDMKKKSTRKGQVRKTARRAYEK